MRVYSYERHVPKSESTDAEYEDAAAYSRTRFAVADGATMSCFAGEWAKKLVMAYQSDRLHPSTLVQDLAPLQDEWEKSHLGMPQPWYLAQKVRKGAFAAFVGLSLDGQGHWDAFAVGDCCLFHAAADGRLHRVFPVERFADFGNTPVLISSNRLHNNFRQPELERGDYAPGDVFLLMSDAVAAFVLRNMEEQPRRATQQSLPFTRSQEVILPSPGPYFGRMLQLPRELTHFNPKNEWFKNWVAVHRECRQMRDDDVTILRIKVVCDGPS